MIVVNLIPEQFVGLQRGRRRLRELQKVLMLSVAAMCVARMVLNVYVSVGYGLQEERVTLLQETQALRRLLDAQELASTQRKQANEQGRALEVRRKLVAFSLRLAGCAVPESTTLSAMHVRQDGIVWLGVSRRPQEVSEMLSRITGCCWARSGADLLGALHMGGSLPA
jgi:ABC-type lipoprotein release transport system permease subunit